MTFLGPERCDSCGETFKDGQPAYQADGEPDWCFHANPDDCGLFKTINDTTEGVE